MNRFFLIFMIFIQFELLPSAPPTVDLRAIPGRIATPRNQLGLLLLINFYKLVKKIPINAKIHALMIFMINYIYFLFVH